MDVHDWDERFAAPELPYGTDPNTFLVEQASAVPAGKVLCIAEGYGRNATWLAAQGFEVTAIEQSGVGIARARELAAQRGVDVTFIQGDLTDADLGDGVWQGIVSIYAHLPPPLRRDLHARVVRALAPGGLFILEAYSPAQLGHRTGGPRDVELLMTSAVLQEELAGLDFVLAQEIEREVNEGRLHMGMAAVVQVVGRKP